MRLELLCDEDYGWKAFYVVAERPAGPSFLPLRDLSFYINVFCRL